MSKRILITGGAGFIAHHVIDKILSTTDWEIITLDRLDFSGNLNRLNEVVSSYPEIERKRVRVIHHDLKAELNPEISSTIGKIDLIGHLAAGSHVDRSITYPLEFVMDNVVGTANILEAMKYSKSVKAGIIVTTDKVYANREWDYGYRENDRLGGHDPYSASKAASELAVSSWRDSFCGLEPHQTSFISVASARAGNVIGGGDWAEDRIVPDSMRALAAGEPIPVRSPSSTRPWQHVLEPLGGYLLLAERLSSIGTASNNPYAGPYNFGPNLESNRPVSDLVQATLRHWPGHWEDISVTSAPHEAGRLHLQIDKACHQLNWSPRWDFDTTVARTVNWYRSVHENISPLHCCVADLDAYQEELNVAS